MNLRRRQQLFAPPPDADRAPANPGRLVHARLDGLLPGPLEHGVVLDSGQPVRVSGRIVVTAPQTVALDERPGPELLQTGPGGDERLTGSVATGIGVHDEAVADPHLLPAGRALGDLHALAVHGDDAGRGLADRAPGDVAGHFRGGDRGHHRRHRLVRGQPVAVVAARGVVAHVVDVAEKVRHRAEAAQAASRGS